MNSSQRNYCPTRRELLAVIAGLQHFRHYLVGASVILRTDHYSLKWLKTFKRPEGILARWIETLAEFDYTVVHRPGRLHSNADGLSPPQAMSTSHPTHIVASYDTMSSRQPGTSTSPDTGVIHPQAASVRHQSIVPPDGSAVAMAPPTCWATYLVQEYRQLREQNVDYKFLLRWCLHHLRSHQTPPPSAGDDVDLALRRIVRHSTVTPPQIDETSSFQDVLSRLHDFYLDMN